MSSIASSSFAGTTVLYNSRVGEDTADLLKGIVAAFGDVQVASVGSSGFLNCKQNTDARFVYVDDHGLSLNACRARQAGIQVFSARSLFAVPPVLEVLRPLCGYKFSLTGMDGVTKARISSRITAELGGVVGDRMDLAVDCLLTAEEPLDSSRVTDLAARRQTPTAKELFANKHSIPALQWEQFLLKASSGLTPFTAIIGALRASQRGAGEGESSLLNISAASRCLEHTSKEDAGVASASLHAIDSEAQVAAHRDVGTAVPSLLENVWGEVSDEDFLEAHLPVVITFVGLTEEEEICCRRLLAECACHRIVAQPVITSMTTHVVVGSTALHDVGAVVDCVQRCQGGAAEAVSTERFKVVSWLLSGILGNDMCAVSDESHARCFRLNYFGHCAVQRDGVSREEKKSVKLPDAFLRPVLAPPQAPQSLAKTPAVSAVTEVPQPVAQQATAEIKLNASAVWKQLTELAREIGVCYSSDAHSSVSEAEIREILGRIVPPCDAGLFQGVTFLCEDEDRDGESETVSMSFLTDRLAALRLVIKACGGVLLRKSRQELREMIDTKSEILRFKRTAEGGAVTQTLVLLPHAFERRRLRYSAAHGRHQTLSRENARSSSLRRKSAVQVPILAVRVPRVTSTWLLASVAHRVCLPLLWPQRAASEQGYHFLRHTPLHIHLHSDLIADASQWLVDHLPVPHSPFLTELRYIKHRLREELLNATAAPAATAGQQAVGHGVCVAIISSTIPAVDKSHLQRAIESLGGTNYTNSEIDLRRVTHVVTDQTKTSVKEPDASVLVAEDGEPIAAGCVVTTHELCCVDDDQVADTLRYISALAANRSDLVLVDVSWLQKSAEVGYFVAEADFVVTEPIAGSGSAALMDHAACGASPIAEPLASHVVVPATVPPASDSDAAELDAALQVKILALERSIGEGNCNTRERRTATKRTAPLAIKIEPPRHSEPMTEESPTISHVAATAVVPSFASSRPCRVYVLSTVPELDSIRTIVTAKFNVPVPTIGSARGNISTLSLPVWTHFEWVATCAEADVVVTNEVTQRESVLFAISAGKWLLRSDYFFACDKEHRIVDPLPFEWGTDMLSAEHRKKKPLQLLATNVRLWRELRMNRNLGPFSPPCINTVIFVDHVSVQDVLSNIVSSGNGVAVCCCPEPPVAPSLLLHQQNVEQQLENAFMRVVNDEVCSMGSLLVFLVSAEIWTQCGAALQDCVSSACAAHRKWQQRQRARRCESECHYALHNRSFLESDNEECELRIEFHSHEWVSLVLQRRLDKLKSPLFTDYI